MTTAREFDGELGVYVKDLTYGTRYSFNGATPFYLASTIKVPVLIAVFREAARGKLSFDERLEVKNEDILDGSPILTEARGATFTLGELVRIMMKRSDNGATDILIRRVGITAVNEVVAQTGVSGFRPITSMLDVRRHIYGHVDPAATQLTPSQFIELREAEVLPERGKLLARMLGRTKAFSRTVMEEAFDAYYASQLNSAPLESMGGLLEQIARGKVISPGASQEMIELMKTCETGSHRLRNDLPPGVELAHKTGTQYRRVCDVGIMYVTPERPVVIAACTKDSSSLASAERAIAKVGRATYDLILADPWRPGASPQHVGAPRAEAERKGGPTTP